MIKQGQDWFWVYGRILKFLSFIITLFLSIILDNIGD